ncbi:MAG: dynamin family protein, partial [Marmoricola sp.]
MVASTYEVSTVLAALETVCEEPWREQLAGLAVRLDAGDLRVLVGGEAKRGKSTLVNALIRRGLLPSGVTPVTALQTVVRQGSPERLEVDFLDGTTEQAVLDELAAYVTQAGNGWNRKKVAEVRVMLERMPDPGLVLVDTPGMGSIIEHNSETASAALGAMDVAVCVLTADAPMSKSEADLLRRFAELSVEVIVVLNKVDLLSPEELQEASTFVRDAARTVLGRTPAIYPCSARTALQARVTDGRAGWVAGGLADLEAALLDRARHGRAETLRASITAAAGRVAAGQVDQISVQIASLEAVRDDRDQELVAFHEALSRTDRLGSEAGDLLVGELDRLHQWLDEAAEQLLTPLT